MAAHSIGHGGRGPQREPVLLLHHAHGFSARLLGLHAFATLAWHTGLWISPCRAVHTFGLPYAIDVVFLGRDTRVLGHVHALGPNRVAWRLAAHSVVELPAGYCAAYPGYESLLRAALRRRQ